MMFLLHILFQNQIFLIPLPVDVICRFIFDLLIVRAQMLSVEVGGHDRYVGWVLLFWWIIGYLHLASLRFSNYT